MKKTLISIFCVLLIATVANAQDSTQRAQEKTKMQTTNSGKQNSNNKGTAKKDLKQLNLSTDQEKQIDNVRSNSRQEKEKIKAIDKESKNKINDVLTPEQREKMKQEKANDKKKNNG